MACQIVKKPPSAPFCRLMWFQPSRKSPPTSKVASRLVTRSSRQIAFAPTWFASSRRCGGYTAAKGRSREQANTVSAVFVALAPLTVGRGRWEERAVSGLRLRQRRAGIEAVQQCRDEKGQRTHAENS